MTMSEMSLDTFEAVEQCVLNKGPKIIILSTENEMTSSSRQQTGRGGFTLWNNTQFIAMSFVCCLNPLIL